MREGGILGRGMSIYKGFGKDGKCVRRKNRVNVGVIGKERGRVLSII